MGIGLLVMAGFMLYGFYLIYARDFAPGKDAWVAGYTVSPHFEARLAHVHGNLFAFLNIVIGYLLMTLAVPKLQAKWVSILAFGGLLMPVGILTEIYMNMPPLLVLIGAISIVAAVTTLGVTVLQMKFTPDSESK